MLLCPGHPWGEVPAQPWRTQSLSADKTSFRGLGLHGRLALTAGTPGLGFKETEAESSPKPPEPAGGRRKDSQLGQQGNAGPGLDEELSRQRGEKNVC